MGGVGSESKREGDRVRFPSSDRGVQEGGKVEGELFAGGRRAVTVMRPLLVPPYPPVLGRRAVRNERGRGGGNSMQAPGSIHSLDARPAVSVWLK